jgi:ABC-2 type transport system permease protein
MRFMALAVRNFKEMFIDYLSLGLTIAFPPVLLLILYQLNNVETYFNATNLAPGIALFGFVMLQFSSAMLLAKDRETSLLARLLTAPLRPRDFISAYSLPYVPVAILQIIMVFATAAILGLETSGSLALVFLVLFVMSIGYIGLGMVAGSLLSYKQVSIFYTGVLLITIFSGAWFDLAFFGNVFEGIMGVFPFAHAINASREVMVNGAGFSDIVGDLIWVLGYTVVFFVLGVYLFRRKMVE